MTKRSEAEICELFTVQAKEQGFKVYPENNGWDLLLVWEGEECVDELESEGARRRRGGPKWILKPGDQIAVEAKARSNVDAFGQAIVRQGRMYGSGPDFIALLAPSWNSSYHQIARRCGFLLFDESHYIGKHRRVCKIIEKKRAWIDTFHFAPIRPLERHRLEFKDKMWTPPVVSESVIAGDSSPRSLTAWRVQALKMCAKLRSGDEVTSRDFKDLGLSMTRWKQGGSYAWIIDTGRKSGRLKLYKLNNPVPGDFPDVGWEADRDALVAQASKDAKT